MMSRVMWLVSEVSERTAMYGFVFVVAGMLALVQEWLKNGMDTPVPELARTITRLMREI